MNKLSTGKSFTTRTTDYRAATNPTNPITERTRGTFGRPPIEQAYIPPRKRDAEEAIEALKNDRTLEANVSADDAKLLRVAIIGKHIEKRAATLVIKRMAAAAK